MTERRARSWQKEMVCRDDDRLVRMNQVNPKYVLRNYLAQTAIEKAQQKDFSEIDRLLTLLQNPYSDQPGMDTCAAPPPTRTSIYRSVARRKPSRSHGILYAPLKSSVPSGGLLDSLSWWVHRVTSRFNGQTYDFRTTQPDHPIPRPCGAVAHVQRLYGERRGVERRDIGEYGYCQWDGGRDSHCGDER